MMRNIAVSIQKFVKLSLTDGFVKSIGNIAKLLPIRGSVDSYLTKAIVNSHLTKAIVKPSLVKCVMMLIVMMLIASVSADEIGNKNRKANKLFSKGQYEEALKLYDDALLLDPSNNKLKMNKGSALYKLDQLDEAEKLYEEALAQEDKKARADAHYNLGNIQYKQGAQLESAGNAASARGKYSQALESYVNTLKLRPNDKDAKWNLQLAHQKVNLLENQPDQEQDENQDQNQDDKGDQNKQKDDKKDQDKKDGQDDNNDDQSKDDQNQDQQDKQDQQDQQQPRDQDERDMKKEEAERLIEQYADDADTLNKPKFQRGRVRQPEKDW